MPFTAEQLAAAGQYAAIAAFHDGFAIQESEMSVLRLIEPVQRRDHTLHPGDCSSCGSHEFRRWQGVSVCAYCRSTASAPTADSFIADRANSVAERYAQWAKVGARYHTER